MHLQDQPGICSPKVMVEAVPVAELPTEGIRSMWMNKKPCLLTSSKGRRANILFNNSDSRISAVADGRAVRSSACWKLVWLYMLINLFLRAW